MDVESCQTLHESRKPTDSLLQVSSSVVMYSLKPSVNENPSCLIYANPLSTPILVISFSSIKLTVLVTHDGAHYHDNEGNDGRGEEEWRGVYGEV